MPPYYNYYNVSGAPQAPKNVTVVASGVIPTLRWNPVSGPIDSYIVQVVQSLDGMLVLENTTDRLEFSLQEIEQQIRNTNQSCEMFEFSVKATNEAGTGPLSMSVEDTIPICKTMQLRNNIFLCDHT